MVAVVTSMLELIIVIIFMATFGDLVLRLVGSAAKAGCGCAAFLTVLAVLAALLVVIG